MGVLSSLKKVFKRSLNPVEWHNLRNTKPVSAVFGLERGTPIDRFYIQQFLQANASYVKGTILEIAENTYSKKYAAPGSSFEVLHYDDQNPAATIVGDLTNTSSLPANMIDCFICTQTFQFIFNFKDAIQGAYHLLKGGGTLLATVAGISQISRYDMDRWGDYWRFTTLSAQKAFEEVFGQGQVTVQHHGNVLTAIAFLEGISAEELKTDELNYKDDNYQLVITIVARKS